MTLKDLFQCFICENPFSQDLISDSSDKLDIHQIVRTGKNINNFTIYYKYFVKINQGYVSTFRKTIIDFIDGHFNIGYTV